MLTEKTKQDYLVTNGYIVSVTDSTGRVNHYGSFDNIDSAVEWASHFHRYNQVVIINPLFNPQVNQG